MRTPLLILVLTALSFSISAQKKIPGRKNTFEISIGINTLGPAPKMGSLMKEYNFDAPSVNWLYGGTIGHPKYASVGSSAKLSYTSSFRSRSRVGFQINYSNLREVSGYSATAEYLFIRFSNFSAVFPFYKYKLEHDIELQAGPVLMISRAKETSSGEHQDKYTGFGIGMLSGFTLRLWEKRVTYAKIDLQYFLATPCIMGPFVAENWAGVMAAIPESRYNFGHLSIGFVLGFNLLQNPYNEE